MLDQFDNRIGELEPRFANRELIEKLSQQRDEFIEELNDVDEELVDALMIDFENEVDDFFA